MTQHNRLQFIYTFLLLFSVDQQQRNNNIVHISFAASTKPYNSDGNIHKSVGESQTTKYIQVSQRIVNKIANDTQNKTEIYTDDIDEYYIQRRIPQKRTSDHNNARSLARTCPCASIVTPSLNMNRLSSLVVVGRQTSFHLSNRLDFVSTRTEVRKSRLSFSTRFQNV